MKSIVTEEASSRVVEIAKELGINPIIAKLLYSRGYTTVKSAKAFLYMESEILTDPFKFADMNKAVERIAAALKNHEKITVYGDYDVDGVTSVCTI